MSKNLVINGVTYNGIDSMEIPNTEGEKVVFIPEDEAGVELPELTRPATESDIMKGKQAIDEDGNVLTGTYVQTVVVGQPSLTLNDAEIDDFTEEDGVARVHAKTTGQVTLAKGAEVSLNLDPEVFGSATPRNVLMECKFTSKYGLNQTGNYTVHIPQRPVFIKPAATSSQVLAGTQAVNDEDELFNGTMPNIGAVNASLSLGGSYTIPEGYHDGTGVVQGAELPQLEHAADPYYIVEGFEAYDAEGNVLVGTMQYAKGVLF